MVVKQLVDEDLLIKQKCLQREITNLLERIKEIDRVLSGPAGMKFNDMPRSEVPFDKVGQMISEKMEKERLLKSFCKDFNSNSAIIKRSFDLMTSLSPLKSGNMTLYQYKDLLQYFYCENKCIKEILAIFKLEDTDSNRRVFYKWLSKALLLLRLGQK